MCLPARGAADMSRISNRASTIAAVLGIVFLVIFLVILWSGVRTTARIEGFEGYRGRNDTGFEDLRQVYDGAGDPLVEDLFGSTEKPIAEENFTNEVLPKEEQDLVRKNEPAVDIFPSAKGDLEFIKLMKISQNQYEDPIDEFSMAKRHHSGHFRHPSAEVWDPHPQYEFTAFGRRFKLRLAHDNSFVSPDIKVTHISGNTTRKEHPGHELGCFYSGVVDDDPHSAVTVSLCQGMTGHMRTSTGSYYIKPTEQWQKNRKDSPESWLQHAIYRVPTMPNSNHWDNSDKPSDRHNCGVIDYDTDDVAVPLSDDSSDSKIYVGGRTRERRSLTEKTALDDSREDDKYEQLVGQAQHHRNLLRDDEHYERYYSVERRRSYPSEEYIQDAEMESDPFVTWRPRRALPREYFIEIMVVADAKMVRYHGEGLVGYILVLMSTVSRIYKDQSIGNPISIAVTKIIKAKDMVGVRHNGGDGIAAADTLKKFCYWQNDNNPHEPSPEHHDAALLLTRENLCHHPDEMRCDTLGLAELGKMCSPVSSCAIVQDNGLGAAFTIAHEIGHVLNMPHDDDPKCNSFKNSSRVHNVMFRTLDNKTFPWEWSKCSRHYVTEFLEEGYGNCLLDKPSSTMTRTDESRLPGEDYSQNEQCELVYGRGSRICSDMGVCKTLWCTTPRDGHRQCHTQYHPWANGTPCGSGKWCHRGECVSRRNLKPVHGQWSEWGAYGKCSRSCGGGVRKKYRECTNPAPEHGGNYCVGESIKYGSCGTRECPPGTPDFREHQCSQLDNNNFNIQNLSSDVKWHAKYSRIPPQDRCKLLCQVESNQYYILSNKVIDGTPCGQDTFHICVNGHCRPAGCDHVLNSMAKLDACGVCRGDNSTCQKITGSYNSTEYGYTRVTKIPAGSSHIDIRQHGWLDSHNDDNYLALRLGERGKYILNGNSTVMHRKVIVFPGVKIEYSGPKSIVERLNSSKAIGTDLILEVLSVGNLYPPQVTYEYVVPKRILNSYTWILSDWTDCNRLCQGMQYRRAECRSTELKDVVPDDYCQPEEKPREESQICNNHCTLQWQITPVSECSSHCGPGTRTVATRCLQVLLNIDHPPRHLQARECSHLERPSEQESCIGPCKVAHWSYGEWGPCSVSCGGGVQLRTAMCVDSSRRQMHEEACAGQEKHLKKSCGQDVCPKWSFGEWKPCSVSCGVGKRQRYHWCHVENRVVADSNCGKLPASVTEVCDAGPCPQWHAGEWSPCSVTCGEGALRRKIVCKSADGSTSDKCSSSNKPEDTAICVLKTCPTVVSVPPITYSSDPPSDDPSQQDNEVDVVTFRSAYDWRIASYRQCSRPCIDGQMNRIVKCISVETRIIAPDDYCDRKKKPPTTIACNRHHCPMWNTGDWSQCDLECGDGYQHRQVRCQSPRGDTLPDEECIDSEKPQIIKLCRRRPCATTSRDERKHRMDTNIERRWRVSSWTPCSKSCGSRIQRRRVECTMRRGNHGPEVPVKDEQCTRLGLARPKTQRVCRRIACGHVWQEGAWSECSAECGDGTQRRTVSCHRVNGYDWIDPTPTQGCPLDHKPAEEQICKLRECGDEFYWTAGPWRKCSHMCGRKGRQTRRSFCHNKNGKKVPHFNCPAKFRPQRKRRCNQRKCGPMSCLEVQKRSRTSKDGEYSLLIGGKNMLIYCHGMASAEPKEFLTLPAGDRENYAEIYDKRLKYPHTCPYNGQRNDSCNCATDVGTISGKTFFRRVRIDPHRLYIHGNDYTFSWTKGAKRVEYGEAGDCYSLANCPQGRFSINLNGTQLKLSTDVTWSTETAGASLEVNKINDQRVFGKCGGYCGFCKPKMGLKLDVLPP